MNEQVSELTWTPFYSLFRREIARFMKVVVQTVVTPFVSATLYLMIFGVSLGERIVLKDQLPYIAFLIPGLVMMGCLNNAFQNSSSTIIASKFSGDLEDIKVSPLTSTQIIFALSAAAVLRGLMVGAITFLVGEMSYYWMYGSLLPIAHPFALIAFLLIGCQAFANFGIVVAFWAKSFDQLSAITGFILMPLIYLGGVFFSIEHLPPFWRVISMGNPLLYMINGVRYGILGSSDVSPLVAMGVSLLALFLTMAFAIRSLAKGSFQRW